MLFCCSSCSSWLALQFGVWYVCLWPVFGELQQVLKSGHWELKSVTDLCDVGYRIYWMKLLQNKKLNWKNLGFLCLMEMEVYQKKMYWLPKMPENPSKARFIIAPGCGSIKPLSKCITAIFKRFQVQISNNCASLKSYTLINSFWIFQIKSYFCYG